MAESGSSHDHESHRCEATGEWRAAARSSGAGGVAVFDRCRCGVVGAPPYCASRSARSSKVVLSEAFHRSRACAMSTV